MIPQTTLTEFENGYRDRHLIHQAVDYWAARKPEATAITNVTSGTRLTWRELQRRSLAYAGEFSRMGFRKGDFLAVSLPLLDDHIVLEYACFRLGVIHAPVDPRLQPNELLWCLKLIHPKGLVFFQPALREVARGCDSIEHLLEYPGSFARFREAEAAALPDNVEEHDGAQVIFTTGSTGSPKPALLTHRGITCQNLCLGEGFGFGPDQSVLCNLPAFHVGGQSELLMTALFHGGTAVTLEAFDPVRSLEAMEHHGVTLVGQIPAMFQLEWRTADYARCDLSSVRKAVYGGQGVPRAFLDKMLEMAPLIATGLGLTEASGFCTYTPSVGRAEEIEGSVGWSMPVYPAAIRQPMDGDGNAGAEVGAGEVGHICFRGPQNFAGYIGDPEATAGALSRDGWLYGRPRRDGRARAAVLGTREVGAEAGGHQVFPSDVESHFSALTDRVANVGVVGHEHLLWSEGIIAFVEKRPEASLTEAELKKHARALTSHMRPLHYVILEAGSMPLNRTAKVDVVRLQQMAREEVARLRARGRWDG